MENPLYNDLPNCDKHRLSWFSDLMFLDLGGFSPLTTSVCREAEFRHRLRKSIRVVMTERCLNRTLDDLTLRRPEHAGALFGPACLPGLITCYRSFNANGTPVMFRVDGAEVMEILGKLKAKGLELRGFVHSHPAGVRWLSQGDRFYVKKLLANPKNTDNWIFMPIVCDGQFLPFAVDKWGHVIHTQFETFCSGD